ncbi:MAG: N-acetylmuramoyl-L-alanine amidase [Alphaproteobacteria bacterium GM202ARS2]|nr:N-acetylmuramoyl-L-alanine amidase [Alphaproteobacteria bacterium GM202ARS2]
MNVTGKQTLVMKDYPSGNWRERGGVTPTLVIIHYTAMTCEAALARLCGTGDKGGQGGRVSSHYVIDEDGTTYRLVDESRCAFHAGEACWRGQRDINERSIGIELVHEGHRHDGGIDPYAEAQMGALESLCLEVMARAGMRASDVWGHSDIAPHRKQDPGETLPWQRLARKGIGIWADADERHVGGASEAQARDALRAIGYGVDVYPFADVVVAFQRHFRPSRVDGVVDASSLALMRAIADAL